MKTNYEEQLSNQGVKNIRTNLAVLFIADTHGDLGFHPEWLDNLPHFDLCILLGDNNEYDIKTVLSKIDKEKVFGVMGNHDLNNQYERLGIRNLSGGKLTIGGVKIGGIGGSFKYKDSVHYPLLTHEDSLRLADVYSDIDILVTHDKPYTVDTIDNAHDGLKGITYAIYKNRIPLHFHGHMHKPKTTVLGNGCKSRCIYGVEVVVISS